MINTMKTPLLDNDENNDCELNNVEDNSNNKNNNLNNINKQPINSISGKDLFSFESTSNKTSNSVSGNNQQNLVSQSENNTNTASNFVNSSPNSAGNNSTIMNSTPSALLCRICYTSDNIKECLFQPCNCSGTMGLMHRTCLEKWLAQSNTSKCEICNFEFTLQRIPRPFEEWLFRPLTYKDNKNLLNDILCFLVLTPLALISTWYCIVFAIKFHETENKWEASGLVVLTSFLVLIYILWLIFSTRYHFRVFKDWQEKNQIVILNIDESKKVDNNLVLMNQTNNKNEFKKQQANIQTINEKLNSLTQSQSQQHQHQQQQQHAQQLQELQISSQQSVSNPNPLEFDLNIINMKTIPNLVEISTIQV